MFNTYNQYYLNSEKYVPLESLSPELNDLLTKKTLTFLKIFRKFDCPLTKYDAIVSSEMKTTLESMGICMVGIGFDSEGLQEFMDGEFWAGGLTIDYDYEIYNVMGLIEKFNPQTTFGQIKNQIIGKLSSKTAEASDEKQDCLMGGTFVINSDGKILYQFRQRTPSGLPDFDKIKKVCQKAHAIHLFNLISSSRTSEASLLSASEELSILLSSPLAKINSK